jgi:hypothetical protein
MTDSPFSGVRLPPELFQSLVPKALAFEPPKIVHPAEAMFHQLAKQIAEFEEQLDDTEEVGARLVSGPNNTTFHVTGVEYKGRELIVFHGLNEHGKTIRLLQHVAQINLLLTALPKETEKPRRIGFTMLKEAEK